MYVDLLILAHLRRAPMHGYEIKKRVAETLGDQFALNNNVLYPALKRFEAMGAVERQVVPQEGRPSRSVYRLTEAGREIFTDLLREFPPQLADSEAEFQVRVAFFDALEPADRLEILAARDAVLRRRAAHVERMSGLLAQSPEDDHPYVRRLMQFVRQQVAAERAWIAGLAAEIAAEAR